MEMPRGCRDYSGLFDGACDDRMGFYNLPVPRTGLNHGVTAVFQKSNTDLSIVCGVSLSARALAIRASVSGF